MASETDPTTDVDEHIGDISLDDATPEEDTPEATVNNDDGKKNGKRAGGKDKKKEVPIEELYDLSKPIKRVSLRFSLFINRSYSTVVILNV